MSSKWTDEQQQLLRDDWAAGLAASQIALRLGVTRNAVCGMARRQELDRRARSNQYSAQHGGKRKRTLKARLTGHGAHVRWPIIEAAPLPPQPVDDLAIPPVPLRSLMQLTDVICRRPVGTLGAVDFFFCGARLKADAPYCAAHCRAAYQGFQAVEE